MSQRSLWIKKDALPKRSSAMCSLACCVAMSPLLFVKMLYNVPTPAATSAILDRRTARGVLVRPCGSGPRRQLTVHVVDLSLAQ